LDVFLPSVLLSLLVMLVEAGQQLGKHEPTCRNILKGISRPGDWAGRQARVETSLNPIDIWRSGI
jgi:hypothetical protein